MPADIDHVADSHDTAGVSLSSREFRTAPGEYVRQRAIQRLGRWWLPVGLVLLSTVVLAFTDLRFVYVLLIELLVAFPMVLCLVWMSEALTDDALRETTWHTVTMGPEGITVVYSEAPEADNGRDDAAGCPVTGYARRKPQYFSWDAFGSYHDAGNCVIIEWADRRRVPLRLPGDAFDEQQWHTAARILARYLK